MGTKKKNLLNKGEFITKINRLNQQNDIKILVDCNITGGGVCGCD